MNLPHDFEQQTQALMGEELFQTLRKGLEETPPTSIRLNPLKTAGHKVSIPLADGRVPWCEQGMYLQSRPNFTFDPLLHSGAYYVQEAGSMFLDHVMRQYVHHPVTMLDLCAAPGGKSTVARAALPAGSVLFSNEPIHVRANVLAENIQKFGHPDCIVTNNYPRDYCKAGILFDVVLADVPCSGEGMFRKDEGAISEWSMQNVAQCQALQLDIIRDIWPCLRPGGLLIYSTCTFNSREDEENVNTIIAELGAEILPVAIEDGWNITGSLLDERPVYRFIPGKTRSEGLFMAVLRKPGEAEETGKKLQKAPRKSDAVKGMEHWLQGDFTFLENKGLIRAIPTVWYGVYAMAVKALKVIHAGVAIGTQKGRDIIPDQSLALSIALREDAFLRIEIDEFTALAYLRKEAIMLPAEAPRGFVLLTYQQLPLGFVKNIGNRANNLYPQEWRIKSSHIPEENTHAICLHDD
uniref:rRNA cytosine-C5-methyltransferase n=1 Tax=Prevotella sp. GTC17260 TaxID=3236796 RepID=A0AB33JA14_9BACT